VRLEEHRGGIDQTAADVGVRDVAGQGQPAGRIGCGIDQVVEGCDAAGGQDDGVTAGEGLLSQGAPDAR
jgi:hypothetical protein